MNKVLKIFLIGICVTAVLAGIAYASIKAYEKIKLKAELTPIFTGKIGDTNIDNIWIGTFQLAWNELIEQVVGKSVEFEDGSSELANELNKKIFTKDMISDDSYYIKVGKTSPEVKNDILNDISEKFGIEKSSLLDDIDFETNENSYTIYSILSKKFEFIIPFDRLGKSKFSNYENQVEYFGINNASKEQLNENVEVLFYNNPNDFSVKLKTKGNDEVILYKTTNTNSFNELYKEVLEKNSEFNEKKEFSEEDELKVPYINIDTLINYDALCGHYIKGTNGMYIANALQNVRFSINEQGGNLTSESGIKSEYLLENENARYFYFTDSFVLFLKENDKELPYFALKVGSLDNLVQ